jgi:sulfatase modifying factor 1
MPRIKTRISGEGMSISSPETADLGRGGMHVHQAWAKSLRGRLVCNAKDGSVLVRIPARELEMGSGGYRDRGELTDYWIGLYPITNRQYQRFISETGHKAPELASSHESHLDQPFRNRAWNSEKEMDHPVVCVSWDDCVSYAEWAGLSLPTEAQWEKAARGPRGLAYPWGHEWDEGNCRNSNNRQNETTAEVWSYPEGASGYGTVQQSGNVWEWCSDCYDWSKNGPPRSGQSVDRVCRGGAWLRDDMSHFCGAYRAPGELGEYTSYLGFRLVANTSTFAKDSVGKP